MALNLTRNTKVYFSTLGTATSGFTNTETFEIPVMEGYSLVQNTDTQVIQPNEAGATPTRGSRTFNTALQPVDWSISTYIRPRLSTNVTAVEAALWNALAGAKSYINTAGQKNATSLIRSATTAGATVTAVYASAFTPAIATGDYVSIIGSSPAIGYDGQYQVTVASTTSFTYVSQETASTTTATVTNAKVNTGSWAECPSFSRLAFEGSNVNTLASFQLIFKIDNAYYRVNNCAIDSANIDFGIDQIAMIKWNGKGTTIQQITGAGTTELAALSAAPTGNFITNKLSTVSLAANIGGGGSAYTVPLTGGSITISNNLQYLTPKQLGVVNQPIGYFTGGRSISGSLNAYLKSGTTGDTNDLYTTLLNGSTATTETKYALQIQLGGSANAVRVELDMQGAFLQIPTIDAQDIVSTVIGFSGQGYAVPNTQTYDMDKKNELVVRYYST